MQGSSFKLSEATVGAACSLLSAKNVDLPEPLAKPSRAALPKNPHFGYLDPAPRVYMRCIVTDPHWTTDMRTIDRPDRPGGQTSKSASFIFESGKIGTQRA